MPLAREKNGDSSIIPGASLIALAFLLFPGSALAEPLDALTSEAPVQVSGSFEGNTSAGAIHLLGSTPQTSVTLQAETVELNYSWRSGLEGGPPWEDAAARQTTDKGARSHVFHSVQLSATPASNPLQLLAFPNTSEPTLSVQSIGETTQAADAPTRLTRVGDSPSTIRSDGNTLGFHYTPSDTWLHGTDADQATMVGNFSLFINNATVTLSQSGDTVWENWTGYREANDTGVTHSFEERLLLLDLENARLDLEAQDQVEFLAASFEATTTGTITAPSVNGKLTTDTGRFLFEQEPLHLEGEGTWRLAKANPSADATASALKLGLGEDAGFAVKGAEPLDTTGTSLPATVPPAGWAALGLLLLVGGVATAYRANAFQRAISRWNEYLYKRWMRKGHARASEREFEAAAEAFNRAIQASPKDPTAWYHHALSLLEAGACKKALERIDKLRASGTHYDPLDVLELEAQAALRLEDVERCRRAIEDLADEHEPMATSFAKDLKLGPETLGESLARRLRSAGDAGMKGYV